VLEYVDDILVDILRYLPQFGTDPLNEMSGPMFFKVAPRLVAYDGVLTRRFDQNPLTREDQQYQDAVQQQSEGRYNGPQLSGVPIPQDAKVVPLSAAQLNNSDWIGQKVIGDAG